MPESAPVSVSEKPTGTPTLTIAERPGWDLPGWSMLGIGLVLLLSGGGAFALGLVNDTIALTVSGVVLFLLSFVALYSSLEVQTQWVEHLGRPSTSFGSHARVVAPALCICLSYRMFARRVAFRVRDGTEVNGGI